MRIAIGSDHAGYELKEYLEGELEDHGFEVYDVGTHSSESVDYPDYAKAVCEKLEREEADFGILICGTGIGMSIAANKCRGIRAALCLFPEMARLARSHNDANVLVLAGRLMGKELAWRTVETFLRTDFDGGRHERRLRKISDMESSR